MSPKIGYERNLLKFTEISVSERNSYFPDDCEVTHFQQFEAALNVPFESNFHPVLQTSPKYSNLYLICQKAKNSVVHGMKARAHDWKKSGSISTIRWKKWEKTKRLVDRKPEGRNVLEKQVAQMDKQLSEECAAWNEVFPRNSWKGADGVDYQKSEKAAKNVIAAYNLFLTLIFVLWIRSKLKNREPKSSKEEKLRLKKANLQLPAEVG